MTKKRPSIIQCRSEEYGLSYYDTFEEAFNAASRDHTIWKMSWDEIGGGRVRMVRRTDNTWEYEPII